MHVFPQLRKLEHKYPTELAVIGVHSAKFTAEKETENVRKAVRRYVINHPVVNDRDFAVWQEYSCRAWPTLMFLDPRGKIIGKQEGEITFEQFDPLIAEMVEEFDREGLIDRTPLAYKAEREPDTPLAFPGKVLAHEPSGRLFISDSNHNRIVVSTLDGDVIQVIGDGEPGLVDGKFKKAQLDHPQGMALDGDVLYVADAENHAIRKADLNKWSVETIAGTGRQARGYAEAGEGQATDLSSPWDLEIRDGSLYIAIAGVHQLWSMELSTGRVAPFAGNGREALLDGPLLMASLDQPSGITADGDKLYFADSEASAIRSADFISSGLVSTIVGQGLFVFGDVDGSGETVRLQHPLGIEFYEDLLYIADTYNNKVKKVFPDTQTVQTFLGSGEPGHRDGRPNEAQFYEPGDVSIATGKLYVADTNNHAIRVADLDTGAVATLELKGL